MHKKLILEAFEKAMTYEREQGVLSPSKSGAAEELSNYIEQEYNFQFGERRLRDYYNAACNGENIELKQQAVRDGLSRYLGYDDFGGFLKRYNEAKKDLLNDIRTEKTEIDVTSFLARFFRRNRTTVLIILGCLIVFLIVNSITKEKWMTWNGNQYVETDFDSRELENGELLLFNENQAERFQKIQPDCNTSFFKPDGSSKIWYGKNQNGKLEYFTYFGKHPETGKTLKPITNYMIKKYICK